MKRYIVHIILILLLSFGLSSLKAQNNYRFSQYMCNELITNPAYAGKQQHLEASLNLRKQWINIPGSPLSQSLMVHSPVFKKNFGVGFNYLNDRIGISNRHYFKLNFSYTLSLEKSKLAIGLALGGIYQNIDWASVETIQQNDPSFDMPNDSYTTPFSSVGLYYYNKRWYAGFSIPEIFTNRLPDTHSMSQNIDVYGKHWHYYFTAGYVFELNSIINLKPSMLFKLVDGSANQVDINLNAFFKNTYMLGVGYHTNDALVFMLAYQFNRIRICYSYDWTLSPLRTYETGTHEISLSYRWQKNETKILSPRYF